MLLNKGPENWATQTQYNTVEKKKYDGVKETLKKHLSESVRLLR
jgi:hypothetical protein